MIAELRPCGDHLGERCGRNLLLLVLAAAVVVLASDGAGILAGGGPVLVLLGQSPVSSSTLGLGVLAPADRLLLSGCLLVLFALDALGTTRGAVAGALGSLAVSDDLVHQHSGVLDGIGQFIAVVPRVEDGIGSLFALVGEVLASLLLVVREQTEHGAGLGPQFLETATYTATLPVAEVDGVAHFSRQIGTDPSQVADQSRALVDGSQSTVDSSRLGTLQLLEQLRTLLLAEHLLDGPHDVGVLEDGDDTEVRALLLGLSLLGNLQGSQASLLGSLLLTTLLSSCLLTSILAEEEAELDDGSVTPPDQPLHAGLQSVVLVDGHDGTAQFVLVVLVHEDAPKRLLQRQPAGCVDLLGCRGGRHSRGDDGVSDAAHNAIRPPRTHESHHLALTFQMPDTAAKKRRPKQEELLRTYL